MDVKLRFDVVYRNKKTKKEIKTKTGYLKMKTDTGGFRLENGSYRGSGARFGSIGTENYQYIIYNTDKSGIDKLQRIRSQKIIRKQYFQIFVQDKVNYNG